MRWLLTAAFLSCMNHSMVLGADPGFESQRAQRIRTGYLAATQRAEEDFQTELRKLRISYSSDLEDALKASTQAGDFAEAQKIQAEKKRVDTLLEANPTQSTEITIKQLTSRTWHRFTPGQPTLSTKFLPNGRLQTLTRSTSFDRWSYQNGVLTLRNKEGKGMDFIRVHDDVFVPPKGSSYKHIWASPN